VQQWEYCRVSLSNRSASTWLRLTPGFKETGVLRRDKKIGDETDSDAAWRFIAQLGLEGWEMTFASDGDADARNFTNYYSFRRLLPSCLPLRSLTG
jgi:hypothetical protein